MFPVTFTVHNNAQLTAVLAALGSGEPPVFLVERHVGKPENAPAPDIDVEKPENAPAPVEKPKAEEKPKAAKTKTTEEKPKAEEKPAALDYDRDVKPLVIALAKDKGKDAATAVLGEFGVSSATQVPPEKWSALIDALKKAAAKEPA